VRAPAAPQREIGLFGAAIASEADVHSLEKELAGRNLAPRALSAKAPLGRKDYTGGRGRNATLKCLGFVISLVMGSTPHASD
jgi:hypothetical protein